MTPSLSDKQVHRFIAALDALQREHGVSLSHEDEHGSFLLRPIDERHMAWVAQARAVHRERL